MFERNTSTGHGCKCKSRTPASGRVTRANAAKADASDSPSLSSREPNRPVVFSKDVGVPARLALARSAVVVWKPARPGQGMRILGGADDDVPPPEIDVRLASLGWLVVSCSPNRDPPLEKMQELAKALCSASRRFAAFGWTSATLYRQNETQLQYQYANVRHASCQPPPVAFVQTGGIPTIGDVSGIVVSFFKLGLAMVTPGLQVEGRPAAGVYNPDGFADRENRPCSLARIAFRKEWLVDADNVRIVSVATHELFHAIQAQYFPVVPTDEVHAITEWWIESTAQVASAQALREIADSGEFPTASDGIRVFRRKDWRRPLWSNEVIDNEAEEYKAMEFFAYLDDGNLDYLKVMFEQIKGRLNGDLLDGRPASYDNATFFLALRAALDPNRNPASVRLSRLYSKVVARQGRAQLGVESYPENLPPAEVAIVPDIAGNGAHVVYLPARLEEWFTVNSGSDLMSPLRALAAQCLRFILPGAVRWEVEWSDDNTRGAAEWLVQARLGNLPEAEQPWLGFGRATAKNGTATVPQAGYLDIDILYVQSDVTTANLRDEKTWGVRVRALAE